MATSSGTTVNHAVMSALNHSGVITRHGASELLTNHACREVATTMATYVSEPVLEVIPTNSLEVFMSVMSITMLYAKDGFCTGKPNVI